MSFQLNGQNYKLKKITSVQQVPIKETVYNFEVEKDHSYIINNIAVHNCDDP